MACWAGLSRRPLMGRIEPRLPLVGWLVGLACQDDHSRAELSPDCHSWAGLSRIESRLPLVGWMSLGGGGCGGVGARHEARGTRHEARGTRHEVVLACRGCRWLWRWCGCVFPWRWWLWRCWHEARGTRHEARGTRHEARGTRHEEMGNEEMGHEEMGQEAKR